MPEPGNVDCVVIGGGIIGCAVALRLRQAGVSVTILERGVPGREATWASAGMLSPQAEAEGPGAALDFGLRSRELYPVFAEELRALAGVDVGYRACGVLWVAVSDEDEVRVRQRLEWQRRAGLPLELLDGAALREAEPALGPEVRAALHIPGDHQVDARLLGEATAQAAVRLGATLRPGCRARRVVVDRGRVTAVEAEGETIATRCVVVAAGAWSAQLEGTGLAGSAIRPVRGQILELDPRPQPLRRVVFSSLGYLVPKPHGRLLAGSTMEEAGFAKEVTVGGVRGILAAAHHLVPQLALASVTDFWSGLRPATVDMKPVLGPGPVEGLVLATGHGRKGVLYAPLTAAVVTDVVTGAAPRVDLAPFAWKRLAS
jgi:glycine oxidase